MKNISLIILAFIALTPVFLYAQAPDYKFGRIPDDELKMEVYENDSTARAVVLYENLNIYYDINLMNGTIRQVRENTVRIKILTPDGTSFADLEIPYYETPNVKESVTGISATSYNLENGKQLKNTVKRQDIFYEQLSERWKQVKLSIPDVRAGSIIEYKYTVHSDRIDIIPDVVFQWSIPVVYSKATAAIPEYLKFNVRAKGFYMLDVKRTTSSKSRTGSGGGTLMYSEEVVTCEAYDIPSIKNEPYVWCLNDFRTELNFELAAYDFPGSLYKPISMSWESVNNLLDESADFSRGLRMSNPYKEEVETIVASTPMGIDRIRAVHKLVLSKLSWNENYRLLPDSRRQVTREGIGSSADINFILMSALRDAGYDPVPILLNPRQYGRLPLTQPSIDKINAFVVGIRSGEELYVLDGTNKHSDVNVLPTALLVDRARFYKVNDSNAWVDLTKLAQNQTQNIMQAKLTPEGTLEGSIIRTYLQQSGMTIKRKYTRAASEEEYLESIENDDNLTIGEYVIVGLDTLRVTEEFSFTKSMNQVGDRVYIPAAGLSFMSKNELAEQDRILPIEYSYPQTIVATCVLEIPEGYEVEEMPERISLSACNNGVRLTYMAQQAGNKINIRMLYQMSRIIYTANEYTDLRTFMDLVVSKSGEQIVLKKI